MARVEMEGYEGRGVDGRMTPREAKALLRAWRASGQPLSVFARARGIGPERLRWWKKKMAGLPSPVRAAGGDARLLPVHVRPEPTVGSVTGAEPDSVFEVRIEASPLSVRVPIGFDAAALRRLLATLREGV